MKWESILKMPMALNTDVERDEQYKQKIIDFERTKIEPAFTEYYQKATAGYSPVFYIAFEYSADQGLQYDRGKGAVFYNLYDNITELGGNTDFILKTIGEIYGQEGWTTEIKNDGRFDRPYLTIRK